MPSANQTTNPVSVDLPVLQGRHSELDDYTVGFESHPQDVDPSAYFRGLPDGIMTSVLDETAVDASIARMVAWLERGETDGLFAPDVFADLTFPHWRLQVAGAEEMDRTKNELHPPAGTTRVERVHRTERGYVLQVEERWDAEGQQWYCREAFICDLDDRGRITELNYYCTGDWDEARVAEHARTVTLLRP